MINFNKAISLFLSTALVAQSLFAESSGKTESTNSTASNSAAVQFDASTTLNAAAGPYVVSAIGQNPYQIKMNASFKNSLKIPYFFTVPSISYGALPSSITSVRTSANQKLPLVLMNYKEVIQEKDATGQSDLGLRMVVASSQDTRESVSNKLAESGLVKTGDIILSARPALAGTIPYIHVQLGITHSGMALVKKDKDGKNYVINIDMPLNAEMLGDNRMSKFTSTHYTEIDKTVGYHSAMYHIIRPKNITEEQRENLAKWLELFRSRSKDIYQVKSKPEANERYANKITFNMDYMNPAYDENKTGDEEMKFVADLGRLALGKSVPKGLTMFCSEFVWAVLSLKDCNPVDKAYKFDGTSTPSCVQKVFEPMPIFGSIYENQQVGNEAQFGMSDGPILLADIMKADATPNSRGISNRARLLNWTVVGTAGKNKGSISEGHKAVEAALLQQNPDFYKGVLGYYALTSVPKVKGFEQQIDMRKSIRHQFNVANRLNYSPTAFFMHAIVPETLLGQKMTQKSMEYISTLYFMPPKSTVKMNGQVMDAYQVLLNAAKATK